MNLREDGHQIHVTSEYVCEQSKLHIQYMQCFFRWVVWCSQGGHDPQEHLAKFDYKLNMKVKIKNVLLYFWLLTWTMSKNLLI